MTTEAYARTSDLHTSHEAAATMRGSNLGEIVLDTLIHLGDHGGTSDEIAEILKRSLQSITPRFAPLERKGLVEKHWLPSIEKFKTRPSRTSKHNKVIYFAATGRPRPERPFILRATRTELKKYIKELEAKLRVKRLRTCRMGTNREQRKFAFLEEKT